MKTEELRAIALEGLKRHALVDQCICDRCKEKYGPEGAPGRCGQCRDSQQGEICIERGAYLSILVELEERVKKDHQGEECPWCVKQVCDECGNPRYRLNPNNLPVSCGKCGGHHLTTKGVRHTSPAVAADHRQAHRLETGKDKRLLAPTFKRLPDGSWGVLGSHLEEGEEVNVERRDGEKVTVKVGVVLETNEYGTSVARITQTPGGWDRR